MKYILSKKYETPELMSKIMGPNPVKLEEELLKDCQIKKRLGCLRPRQRSGVDLGFPC